MCEKRYHIISRYVAPPFLEKYATEANGLVVPEYNEPCDGNARSGLLHQILNHIILGIGMHGGRLKSVTDSIRLVDSYSLESKHKVKLLPLPLIKDSFAKEIKDMTKKEIKTILKNAYNKHALLHKKGHNKKRNKTKRINKKTPKSLKSRK